MATLIGLAVNYISQQLFSQPNTSNISDTQQNRSNVIGMGVSTIVNNILPGANGILKGIFAGGVLGGISGGLSAGIDASFSGGNFGDTFWAGFKSGAITGGAMGGVKGYFTAKAKNLNVWTGAPKRNDYLELASYINAGGDGYKFHITDIKDLQMGYDYYYLSDENRVGAWLQIGVDGVCQDYNWVQTVVSSDYNHVPFIDGSNDKGFWRPEGLGDRFTGYPWGFQDVPHHSVKGNLVWRAELSLVGKMNGQWNTIASFKYGFTNKTLIPFTINKNPSYYHMGVVNRANQLHSNH